MTPMSPMSTELMPIGNHHQNSNNHHNNHHNNGHANSEANNHNQYNRISSTSSYNNQKPYIPGKWQMTFQNQNLI